MLRIYTAKKDHRCDDCGHRIPAGARYWRDYRASGDGDCTHDRKSHTNCEEYCREDHIAPYARRGRDGRLAKAEAFEV